MEAFALAEPAVTQFGFSHAISAIEAALVDVFELEGLPLPATLATATGSIQRSPVVLTARAYTGKHLRFARVVTMIGGPIEVTDLLVVPSATSSAPILAIELESDDRERGYAMADLISMVDDDITNAAQLRELAYRRPMMASNDAQLGLVPLGELPA